MQKPKKSPVRPSETAPEELKIRHLLPTKDRPKNERGPRKKSSKLPSTNEMCESTWELLRDIIVDPFQIIINIITALLKQNILMPKIVHILEACMEDLIRLQIEFGWKKKPKYYNGSDLRELITTMAKDVDPTVANILIEYINHEFIGSEIASEKDEVLVRRIMKDFKTSETMATLKRDKKINIIDESIIIEILQNLKWDMDVFKLNGFTNGQPLTLVMLFIFDEYDFFTICDIDKDNFVHFIFEVEEAYNESLPYHNSIHATDVVLCVNHLLSTPCLKIQVTHFEWATILIAAAVHDVGHLGYMNSFLIKTKHELAELYQEESIMEHHHIDTTLAIIGKEHCDITSNMTKDYARKFKILMKKIILGTDMIRHQSQIDTLEGMRGAIGAKDFNVPKENNKRAKLWESLVHCCDISNPTKPFATYDNWIDRVEEEFFNQGDLERELGFTTISPMCDSRTTNFMECQIGFIDYVVAPIWSVWCKAVYPEAQEIIHNLSENRAIITAKLKEPSSADKTSRRSTQESTTTNSKSAVATPKKSV